MLHYYYIIAMTIAYFSPHEDVMRWLCQAHDLVIFTTWVARWLSIFDKAYIFIIVLTIDHPMWYREYSSRLPLYTINRSSISTCKLYNKSEKKKQKNAYVFALADENISFSNENVDFLACRAEWAGPASHEYRSGREIQVSLPNLGWKICWSGREIQVLLPNLVLKV